MSQPWRIVSWTIGFAALVPCATSTEPGDTQFLVEAYQGASPSPATRTYRVVAAGALEAEALQAVTHARTRLAGLGLIAARPGETPEVELIVSLDITETKKVSSRYFRRFRPVTHHRHTFDIEVPEEGGGTALVRQDVIVPVQQNYRAVSSRRPAVTIFAKRFVIAAREIPAAAGSPATVRELWRVVVTNRDGQSDPAAYARMMTTIALDQVQRRVVGRQSVRFSDRLVADASE